MRYRALSFTDILLVMETERRYESGTLSLSVMQTQAPTTLATPLAHLPSS